MQMIFSLVAGNVNAGVNLGERSYNRFVQWVAFAEFLWRSLGR